MAASSKYRRMPINTEVEVSQVRDVIAGQGCIHLKGSNGGVHREVPDVGWKYLEKLNPSFKFVVWDGDWLQPGGFSQLINLC